MIRSFLTQNPKMTTYTQSWHLLSFTNQELSTVNRQGNSKVWMAEKTLVAKNQNKVLKLRLWRAGSIVNKEIHGKWKLKSSTFNRYMFRYIQTSMSCEISTLKGDGNLTGRVSFLRFKLVYRPIPFGSESSLSIFFLLLTHALSLPFLSLHSR